MVLQDQNRTANLRVPAHRSTSPGKPTKESQNLRLRPSILILPKLATTLEYSMGEITLVPSQRAPFWTATQGGKTSQGIARQKTFFSLISVFVLPHFRL